MVSDINQASLNQKKENIMLKKMFRDNKLYFVILRAWPAHDKWGSLWRRVKLTTGTAALAKSALNQKVAAETLLLTFKF